MKSPRELADDIKAQAERLMPKPDQVYSIHGKIRSLTRKFDEPGPDMADVQDFHVPEDAFNVPVRLYIPKTLEPAHKDSGPCLIYLHGGGFVTCDIDSHESLCTRIAASAGMRVLSAEYRLAPEYPYPAGPEDCEAVLQWALAGGGAPHGIDKDNIAIGGDSAGGNMAAYLAQKYRAELKAQVLFYPVMQLAEVKPPKPGLQDALQLGVVALNFILKHYVAGADVHETRLSPLFEKNLKGLPPAFILTCGLDPLRAEGRLYSEYLVAHGVPVKYVHEKAMPHGYLNFSKPFPAAKKTPLATAAFLRDTLLSK